MNTEEQRTESYQTGGRGSTAKESPDNSMVRIPCVFLPVIVIMDRPDIKQLSFLAGFDCGVFTCILADFLSYDCYLEYTQDHINTCREKIGLSIIKGDVSI
jgi:hypothetical protein